MKRAISFFLLALFVLFIIQPNLDAKTQTAQIRTPEMTDSVLTNDDISRKTSKSQATIVIDPDKGGMDAGYDPVGHLAEKDVAMQLAINIGGALESAGYHVEYTRWYDNVETFNTRTESDQNRLDIAKSMNPQYLISIRFNTGDSLSKGFSVFTQPDKEHQQGEDYQAEFRQQDQHAGVLHDSMENSPKSLRPEGELYQLKPVHRGHDEGGQKGHHPATYPGDGSADQLGQHQLPGPDGESMHQIALIAQQSLGEAVDHKDDSDDEHGSQNGYKGENRNA